MPTRYYITLGATTTAGGTVATASAQLALNGVKVALEGDQVTCPACASTGIIEAAGSRMPARDNGRQYALSDDLCLCRCDPPPRLVAAQAAAAQSCA